MSAHHLKGHLFLAIFSLCLLTFPASGEANTQVTYTLGNGLEVILLENHRAPVVSALVWVKTGSAQERPDEIGLAHMMEHMLFKGTAMRGPGEIARQIEAAGGHINAYTSFDQTVYYFDIAGRFAENGLAVLSDMVFNPAFDPVEFEREKEVVIEEIKRSRDIPARRLSENLFGQAYQVHPYGRPIIGFADSVKNISRKTAVDFYQRWYTPRNMLLVISGDFQPDKIKPLLESSFGQIERPEVAAGLPPVEPVQEAARVVIVREDVKEARLGLAFHIPEISSDDTKLLDLLSVVLGQGRTSRLYRQVKYGRELVREVHATSFTPMDPGLFYIDCSLSPEQVLPALVAILHETYSLGGADIQPEELARAKLRIKADFIRTRSTMSGEARVAASFTALLGDLEAKDRYLSELEKVTPADMKRVAARYFQPANLTIGLMLPEKAQAELTGDRLRKLAAPPEPRLKSAALSASASAVPVNLKSAAEPVIAAPSAKASTDRPEVIRYTLENGADLLVKPDPSLPLVSIRVAFLGGLRFETPENNGINHFLSLVWDKGTTRLSAKALAEAVEDMAGQISSFSGRNSFGLEAEFLSQHLDAGLELLADVLLNPAFRADEVAMARADILSSIKREQEDLIRRAVNLLSRNLYGRNPYALNILGTPESINNITAETLKAYYHKWAVPENMVMAVVGDIDPVRVKARLEELIGRRRTPGFSLPDIKPPLPLEAPVSDHEKLERAQVHLILGFLAPGLNSPDRYSLEVLERVLSGQGGRLFVELRDKQSLAYSVSSIYRPALDAGIFGLYIAFDPAKYEQVKQGLLASVRNLTAESITAEELDRAKKNLLGNFEIGLQRNSSQAADLALNELYGLGHDYRYQYVQGITGVSSADLLKAARLYLDLNRAVAVTVGPVEAWDLTKLSH